MRDELLAYLLNDLDEEQRNRIEARLESDPIWRHELERLRTMVETQEQEELAEVDEVPDDLVNRTCQFVKEASSHGAFSPAVLPASLTESCEVDAPSAQRWSMVDWAVVACILAAVGMLLFPALQESREASRRSLCEARLQQLGKVLDNYQIQHRGQLPPIEQHENAGMFAVKLAEQGFLTREQLAELLICPSTTLADDVFSGKVVFRIPTRQELDVAVGEQLNSLLEQMAGSFAYRIGYFDEQGNFHQIQFTGSHRAPMMADKPTFGVVGFLSTHHGGCGQNVLFQDLSVKFIRSCTQDGQDQHWFLNNKKQQAAGIGEHDVVLARSEAGPRGIMSVKGPRLVVPTTKP